jgi:crossover junction endodeoxyribonuclease RusA
MSKPGQPQRKTPAILHLTLPMPPSINEQYATVGRQRVLTAHARQFKRQVQRVFREHISSGALHSELLACFREGYLVVALDFYFETPLQRDLDGGLKIALDALCEGLGVNDNRVVDIHLTKRIDPLHPHLDVELEALADWQFDKEYVLLP